MVVFAGPPVPLLSSVRPARDPPQPDRPPAMGIVRAAEVAPSPPSPRLGQTHRESYCYCCCCLCVDPRDSGGESSLAEKTRGQTPRKINSRKREGFPGHEFASTRAFFFFFLLLLELESIPILRADLVAVPGSDRLTRSPRPLKPSACEVSTSSSGRGDCGPAKPPRIFFIFFFSSLHGIVYMMRNGGTRGTTCCTGCVIFIFCHFLHASFNSPKIICRFLFFCIPKKRKACVFNFRAAAKPYLFQIFFAAGGGGTRARPTQLKGRTGS